MDDDAHARRRRGAGVVTANACTECRKKRAKVEFLEFKFGYSSTEVPVVRWPDSVPSVHIPKC